MEKTELAVYLEIDDMGIDEDGKPVPAGMKVSFGEAENLPPYEELTRDLNLAALIDLVHMFHLHEKLAQNKIRIITPKQYEEQYGEEPDDDMKGEGAFDTIPNTGNRTPDSI